MKLKRREARENAMLALYEASFNANSIEDIIASSRETNEHPVDSYGEAILTNFYANSAEVDDLIRAKLVKWTLDRLPRVDAAILRMAVTEMLYSEEDMDSIVINEAVEIAKKYAADADSYQFINGVLGSISREKSGQNAEDAAADAPLASAAPAEEAAAPAADIPANAESAAPAAADAAADIAPAAQTADGQSAAASAAPDAPEA